MDLNFPEDIASYGQRPITAMHLHVCPICQVAWVHGFSETSNCYAGRSVYCPRCNREEEGSA